MQKLLILISPLGLTTVGDLRTCQSSCFIWLSFENYKEHINAHLYILLIGSRYFYEI